MFEFILFGVSKERMGTMPDFDFVVCGLQIKHWRGALISYENWCGAIDWDVLWSRRLFKYIEKKIKD